MRNLGLTLFVALAICEAMAGRRYIAIPVDGFDVIELSPLPQAPRLPRQTTEAYVPVPVASLHHQQDVDLDVVQRPERSAHILDYVDFGAQHGQNGAFSWYADYPAHR